VVGEFTRCGSIGAYAIGHEACRRGHDTLFAPTTNLFQWLNAGRADESYTKRMKQLIRTPLLILDDFGLKPLTEQQQSDLYDVIAERYEKAATVITSNRDFSEWPAVFKNPLMASAAMDRLVHRAARITVEGKSFRKEEFTKRVKGASTKADNN
jgi:DNA replication protein DnaC